MPPATKLQLENPDFKTTSKRIRRPSEEAPQERSPVKRQQIAANPTARCDA